MEEQVKRKVGFERLEERVLPSGAGVIVSSEGIARLLASIGDSAVLAIGSYDAFPEPPGLTAAGAVALGTGIAVAGAKMHKKDRSGTGEPGDGPDPKSDDRPEDHPHS